MSNTFTKQEKVAFEAVCEKFEDGEVMTKLCKVDRRNSTEMFRSNDTYWKPMPYYATSFDGQDQTNNFKSIHQLAVPRTIQFHKSVPFVLDQNDLRDAINSQEFGVAAQEKLASDINVAALRAASTQGSIVIKSTRASNGYADVADIDATLNALGIAKANRNLALSSRSYNAMASDLAARQTMTGKPTNAFEESYVGRVAGFETHKLDYAISLSAKTAVATISEANQFYTPATQKTQTDGSKTNVDNRYQELKINVSSGTVKVGDCFTVAGVNSVHGVTKADTGYAKTVRVVEVVSGGTGATVVKITPALVSGQGGTQIEAMYQNVTATPANGAALTFLNTATADVNPFWTKEAIEIIPGFIGTDASSYALTYTTQSGVQIVLTKQYDIDTKTYKYRFDTKFGVTVANPEMCGVLLLNQT